MSAATPDRQNLPVLTGKHRRSGPAKSAGHSIEEYALNNTHIKKTQGRNAFRKKSTKKMGDLDIHGFRGVTRAQFAWRNVILR